MIATEPADYAVLSTGAVAWSAIELAKRSESIVKTIVVLLLDTGDRYLSTPLLLNK